jgi:hypothetical protein
LYKDRTVLTLFNLFRLAIHIHRPFKSTKLVYYYECRLKKTETDPTRLVPNRGVRTGPSAYGLFCTYNATKLVEYPLFA